MKSILLFVLLACSTLVLEAKNLNNISPTDDLQKQLSEMVVNSNIWQGAEDNLELMVTFTINENGEIVVLSTNDEQWDIALKSALNYKKIKVNASVKNKIYHLPIFLEYVK